MGLKIKIDNLLRAKNTEWKIGFVTLFYLAYFTTIIFVGPYIIYFFIVIFGLNSYLPLMIFVFGVGPVFSFYFVSILVGNFRLSRFKKVFWYTIHTTVVLGVPMVILLFLVIQGVREIFNTL